MKNKQITYLGIISGVILIMVVGLVSAIGVSSNYNIENPVMVYPGETKEVFVGLKSSLSEGDLKIKAELIESAGIAELIDSNLEYSVSPGIDGEAKVNIRLKIPEDAVIGSMYEVKTRFSEINQPLEGGTVNFKTSAESSLPVKVVEKPLVTETPQEEIGTGWIILGIIIIIAVIIIIYFIIKSRRK